METRLLTSILSGIFLVICITYFTTGLSGNASLDGNDSLNTGNKSIHASYSLSCKSNVQLSLGSEGYGVLEPQMLLADKFADYSRFEVEIVNPPVGTDTADCSMVGSTIMVEVYDTIDDIKCWSNVLVEDKLPPQFNCDTVTVPCNVDPYATNDSLFLPTLSDNCSEVEDLNITFNQSQSSPSCQSPYVLIVNRTWFISDESGNLASCNQVILFERPDLNDIVFPENDTLYCPNTNTDPAETGMPTLFGEPVSIQCGLMVWNEDNFIDKCGETFKLFRTWYVMDWCRNLQRSSLQMIFLEDTTAPVINCPSDQTISNAPSECFAFYDIPNIEVTDECTNPGDFTFDYYVNGVFTNQTQNLQLEVGENSIRIVVRDACLNSSECIYTVTVADTETPVVVCYNDNLSLPSSGDITVGPEVFQSIQYTDNCGIVDTMIRRVNTDCGNSDDQIFGDEVTFCCEDVGDTVMVEVKGIDAAGNMNSCMFMLEIQDKLPPNLICPPDTTVTCDSLSNDLSDYGSPFITDNCLFTVDSTVISNTNICMEGSIERTWIATDEFGNMASCTQVITVVNPYEFDESSIVWPADTTISACVMGGLHPDSINSTPQFEQTPCETVGLTYTDMTMDPDSACLLIMRTWTITDFCEDEDTVYIQMINVLNNAPPVLSVPADTILYADAACLGAAALDSAVTNDCSSGVIFENSYSSQGALVDTTFPLGTTLIIFTATDECNNVSTDTTVITVVDTISPEITCILDTVFSTDEGVCEATVILPLPETSDNCSIISLVNDYNSTTDASDVYPLGQTTVVYTVEDGSGNTSTCSFTVTVEDNEPPQLVCPTDTFNFYLDSNCEVTIPDFTDSITVTDNCTPVDDIVLTQTPMSGDVLMMVQDTTIQIIAQDTSGNSDTCLIAIRLVDTLPPSIICPEDDTLFVDANCEAMIGDYRPQAMVMSNCTQMMNIQIDQTPDSGSIVSGADTVIVVTMTAEDASGNMMSCTFNITLLDTIFPTITGLNDTTASTDPGLCGAFIAFSIPFVADNCIIDSLYNDYNFGEDASDFYPVGDTIVRYFVEDGSGNVTVDSFTVTVNDNEDPNLICQNDTTLFLDANCEATIPDFTQIIIVTDNCTETDSIILTQTPSPNTIYQGEGDTTVIITATDEYGNSSTCSILVNFEDTIPPTLICPSSDTLYANANCEVILPNYIVRSTISDNCTSPPNIITTQNPGVSSIIRGPDTTITVIITATDEAGFTSQCSLEVTILDTLPPVIDCPENDTVFTSAGECEAFVNILIPFTNDNCGVDSLYNDYNGEENASDIYPIGTTTVTYTVTDSSGNSATCSFTVTVLDDEDPMIICPPDMTVNLNNMCEALIPDFRDIVVINDNCSPVDSLVVEQDPPPFTVYTGIGDTTIRLIVFDQSGNSDTCFLDVTFADSTAATIICPGPQTLMADSNCQAIVPDYTALVLVDDNCSDSVNVVLTQSPIPGTVIGPADTTFTVTITAEDESGNISQCDFPITILDTIPPSIICPADQTVSTDPGLCEAFVNIPLPLVDDNCGVDTFYNDSTLTEDASRVYPLGVSIITYTVIDINGNSSTCNFSITVEDNEPPMVVCPPDQTISLQSNCELVLPDFTGDATVSDNCSPADSISLTQIPPAGVILSGEGDTTILIVGTDGAGNSDTCGFVLTRVDLIPPTIICPANDTQYVDLNCSYEIGNYRDFAIVSDNCTDTTSIQIDQIPDSGTIITGADTTVVIVLIATDLSGNSDTCTFDLILLDTISPMITCPDDVTVFADENCKAIIPDLTDSVVLSDNCDPDMEIIATQSPSPGDTLMGEQTIVLTFTVTDNSGQTQTCQISLTVEDTIPPMLSCPPDTQLAADSMCNIVIPNFLDSILVSDNCTDSINLILNQNPAPDSIINAQAGDTIIIVITAQDSSGNSDTCQILIEVIDTTAPTLICTGDTAFVFLDENCDGVIPDLSAEIVESEDNCTGNSQLTITQLPPAGTMFMVSGSFDTTVVITVEDENGNSASCEIPVSFLDTIPPAIICPADTLVECGYPFDLDELSADFGSATASDNCSGTTIITTDIIQRNNCDLIQTITRIFIATDGEGNADTCMQVISVDGSIFELDSTDFTFQDTVTTTDCNFVEPSDIPNSIPMLDTTLMACNIIGIEYSDSTNPNPGMGCIEIFRTFTVTDSCNFDPATGEGQFHFDQYVIIQDTSSPSFTVPTQDTMVYLDSCGTVDVILDTVSASDCAGIDTIYNNSPFAFSTSGGDVSGAYAFGIHNVNVYAVDSCGNIDSTTIMITVTDSFPDTLNCNFKIIQDLDSNTLSATFISHEFFGSYVDSCGNAPLGEITTSFDPSDLSDTIIVITCDSIDSAGGNFIQPDVLYIFLNGVLIDSCNIELGIENPEICNQNTLTGRVTSIRGIQFNGAMIKVYNDFMSKGVRTDEQGFYSVNGLRSNQKYWIDPAFEGDPREGISTFDLLLIYRHILDMGPIENPYYNIAADVDKSGTISGSDLIHLKKLILRMENELPVDNWRFVRTNYEFTDPGHACSSDYTERTEIMARNTIDNLDFFGLKVGDIDGSMSGNVRGRSASTLLEVQKAESGVISFISQRSDIIRGFQMAISIDQYQDIQLINGAIKLKHEDFSMMENGLILISWVAPHGVAIEKGETLFSMGGINSGNLADVIKLNSKYMNPEIYWNDEESPSDIALKFVSQDSEFALYQNTPNPWMNKTTISFNLKDKGELMLTVVNAEGKEVYQTPIAGQAGYNEVDIEASDLDGAGLYFYQLKGEDFNASKKMILLQ